MLHVNTNTTLIPKRAREKVGNRKKRYKLDQGENGQQQADLKRRRRGRAREEERGREGEMAERKKGIKEKKPNDCILLCHPQIITSKALSPLS